MRHRTTYLMLAALLVVFGGILTQRWLSSRAQSTIEKRQVILALPQTVQVDRITVQHGTTTAELARQGEPWVVQSAGNAAAADTVTQVLNAFKGLQILSEAGTAATDADRAAFGLQPDQRAHLTFQASGKIVRELWLGRPEEYNFDLTAYAQEPNNSVVYLVQPVPVDVFTRNEWRDMGIWDFPVDQVREINYTTGKKTFTMVRTNDSWTIGKQQALDSVADPFLSMLAGISAKEFLAPDTAFKPLNIVIGVTLADLSLELSLGQAPNPDEAYLKTSDGKMYVISGATRQLLTKTKEDFLPQPLPPQKSQRKPAGAIKPPPF